jgi:CRP/FNR family transcriptional regulator
MPQSHLHNAATLLKNLQTIGLLRGLDETVLTELATTAIWREYAPGAVVFLEGEASSALYVLDFGWLKVIKSSLDGREQILRFVSPGEIFNEIGVFANRPNPATVMALEAAGIWLIPKPALQQVLKVHPDVALRVIENMAQRITHLVGMVADLSLHSIETRIAHLLLAEAEGDVFHRQRWATQTELAARLGTVPDVLSRALRGMVDAGLIELDRQAIRILQRQAIETLAQAKE